MSMGNTCLIRRIIFSVITLSLSSFLTLSAAVRNTRPVSKNSSSAAGSEIKAPDFAYPQTVTTNAEAALKKAQAANDPQATVRAIMDIALAQSAIGNDKLQPVARRIAQMSRASSSKITSSMLDLLLAQIYNSVYTSSKYKYDTRSLPLSPRSADYTEWSGEQFRTVIDSLCCAALTPATQLQAEPLANYTSIITSDAASRIYYPTLYDFVASQSISIRSSLSPFSNAFPAIFLCPERLFVVMPKFVPSSTVASGVLDTYAQWLAFHASDTAPLINIDLQRIKTVANGIYSAQADSAMHTEYEALRSLYDRFSDSEYSADILLAIADSPLSSIDDYPVNARWIYTQLNDAAKRFPAYRRMNCLKYAIAQLEQKSYRLTTPIHTAPGQEFKLALYGVNTPSVTVDIFRLKDELSTDTYYNTRNNAASGRKLIKSVTLNLSGSVPFAADTTAIVTIDDEGVYVAIPRGEKQSNRSYQKIYCSRLALASMQLSSTVAVVIDPLTGSPVADASLMTSVRSGRSYTWVDQGKTDADGFLKVPTGVSGQAIPVKGTDRFASPSYIESYRPYQEKPDTAAMIYTDLSIYHPGDTVEWVGILYSISSEGNRLVPDMNITASLFGTNGTNVAEQKAVTDSYGRATGKFVIPSGDLTGRYTLFIKKGNNRNAGSASFMVSDYKMPTFAVRVTDTSRNQPTQGAVTLRGDAMTYSGVPVSASEAKLELSVAQNLWWRTSNAVPFYTATATTAADGRFTFELPKELIENSPAPRGVFTARITVTSLSGESQQTSSTFTMGPQLLIVASLPENMNVSDKLTPINVKVIDGSGKAVDRMVDYKVIPEAGGNPVVSGQISTKSPAVDWRTVPGGRYKVVFSLPDSEEADSLVSTPVVIYRPSDRQSPVDAPVWVAQNGTTVNIAKGRKAEILYGTSAPTAYVLYTLWTPERIIEQRWLKEKPGLHRLEVKLPEGTEKATVTLSSTYRFVNASSNVTIADADADKSISIVTETFRDRLQPGQQEHWTLRVVNRDSSGVQAAIIADMYNAALDQFATQSWNMSPRRFYQPGFRWNSPDISGNTYTSFRTAIDNQDCSDLVAPAFRTYGRSFNGLSGIRIRGGVVNELKMSAASPALGAVITTEEVADASFSRADQVVQVAEHKQAIKVEAAEAETDDAGEAENGAVASTQEPEFSYRTGEVPLAFFRPSLTTDADGRLQLEFTVPNANTTWSFNAIAFTSDLRNASASRTVIASKKVMVQPNLPRFLRFGDKARVEATVMNNSDDAEQITVVTELFDAASGKVTFTSDTVISIAAGATAVTAITVNAPLDTPFLGYRIKASTATASDGEQALITLLPYTTPVIETIPFYMAPDSARASIQLPVMKQNARVTLQFCENPAWYVVTALPGLSDSEPRTAPDAASAIFSAAVADGLLRNYPEIATAIKEWTQSDRSDSTLVSMLERNADLKTVLLRATPWMMDARSDTERMQRLALLFDRDRIDDVYSKCTALLSKLRRADGGWAWTAQSSESSEWATETVLELFGRLNQLGYMPQVKELKAMIDPALSMVEKAICADYRKNPSADYTDYVMLLDAWPSFKPGTTSQRIINTTVQRTVKGWKKMSVASKATAALLLSRHGYKSVAGTILTSLRQYAESTPGQGMWWPSVGDTYGGSMTQLAISARALEAFAAIDPQSRDIDAIRQWLILQKETRNWGSSAITSSVIASFLTTSQRWIKTAEGSLIMVGAEAVVPQAIEQRLGYFRTDISQLSPSGAILTVDKKGNTPAWGAVYCQYADDMRSVKAASCEAVSIEKILYKQQGTGWAEATDLQVGDRVKVELLIHVNRDLEYVAITDDRAACLEPVEQMPQPIWAEGICFYRENADAATSIFVTHLPKGTYRLNYELWVNNAGTFSSGLATLQSQYAPQITAHSAGTTLSAVR